MTTKTDNRDNVVDLRVNADTGEVLDENSNGTGRTLEQLAEEARELAEDMPGFIRGSNPQLSFEIGGRGKPDSSEIKVKGSSFPMLGQFPKNKRVKFLIDTEIETITAKTDRDKDRYVVGHTRVHHAEVQGIRVSPIDEALALLDEHGVTNKALVADLTDLLG